MQTTPESIPRIAKEELSGLLEEGKPLVIVDARDPSVYARSDVTPQGAVRIAPGSLNGEVARLPKDALIVTVCT